MVTQEISRDKKASLGARDSPLTAATSSLSSLLKSLKGVLAHLSRLLCLEEFQVIPGQAFPGLHWVDGRCLFLSGNYEEALGQQL